MPDGVIIRFDYGRNHTVGANGARRTWKHCGSERTYLRTPVKTQGKDLTTVAESPLRKVSSVPFVLTLVRVARGAAEKSDSRPRVARYGKIFGKDGRSVVIAKTSWMTRSFGRCCGSKV